MAKTNPCLQSKTDEPPTEAGDSHTAPLAARPPHTLPSAFTVPSNGGIFM